MFLNTGIDIIDTLRFKKQYQMGKNQFFERIFTKREIKYCLKRKKPYIHFAGKFAAKEAFFKAIGSGKRKPFRWKEVEILNGDSGIPFINISGSVKKYVEENNFEGISLSISHIEEYATAVVIIYNHR